MLRIDWVRRTRAHRFLTGAFLSEDRRFPSGCLLTPDAEGVIQLFPSRALHKFSQSELGRGEELGRIELTLYWVGYGRYPYINIQRIKLLRVRGPLSIERTITDL